MGSETEKTSAWSDEDRREMARQRAVDNRPAWERDERGHPIPVPARWEGHICPDYEHCSLCVREAWDCGAAVLGGLTAMATEIRAREFRREWAIHAHAIEAAGITLFEDTDSVQQELVSGASLDEPRNR